MEYAEVNGVRYPKVKITWRDIIGAGSFGVMVTEGYLFDTFEEDGEKYIRTFASYQISDEAAFGDRNCFPFSVLTSESQRDVEIALLYMD